MVKFEVDKQIRDYFIMKAYKNTPKWKAGKNKRNIIGYGGLLTPVVLFFVLILFSLLGGNGIGKAILYSSIFSLISMIVLWPIAIVTLKAQIHNAKIVPENRKGDQVIFDEDLISYVYLNLTDGFMYETLIRYRDITKLQYSDLRKTLYVFCGYSTKVTKNAKSVKEFRLAKESGQYITIPMYYKNVDQMFAVMEQKSGLSIEIIEKQ